MFKKLFIIQIIILTNFTLISQSSTYSKFFNLTNGNEVLENIYLIENKYYVLGGGINFPNSGGYTDNDFVFIIDKDLGISKFIDHENNNYWASSNSIKYRGDTIYALGFNPYTLPNYWTLYKYDLELNILDQNKYYFPSPDSITYARGIEMGNESLFLLGETSFGPWQVNYDDVILLKTDLAGNRIKETRFPEIAEPPYMYACQDIKKMADGNFLISAVQFHYDSQGLDGIHSIFIKVDENLDTLWTKQYSFCTDLKNYPLIAPTQDGGAIISRSIFTYDFYHDLNIDTLYKYSDYPIWIGKLDNSGNTVWQDTLWSYRYDTLSIYPDPEIYTKRIITTKNNDIVICGSYQDYKPKSKLRAYIVRLDQNGKKLWEKVYEDKNLECKSGTFFDIKEADNGDLVAVGEYYDKNGEWNNEIAGWLLRVDKDGCIEPGCGTKDTLDLVIIDSEFYTDIEEVEPEEEFQSGTGFYLYPNPTTTKFKIEYDVNKSDLLNVSIYDWQGRKSTEIKNIKHNSEIDVTNFNKGIYLVVISDESGKIIKSEKLIVQ